MYIECVTICVNYADFLAHTLPHNKQHFDHLIVVTTPEDKDTQNICMHHNVECLTTREMDDGLGGFNKAKGINVALQYLSRRDWVIHLDADIYLPPLTRSILEKIDLDKQNIYGMDRMMCPTFEEWVKYITNPTLTHSGWVYIHPTIFPMGVRIAEFMNKGYEPIGFFQMWHPITSDIKLYPDDHSGADRTDVLHAKKWKRKNRVLIPEIIAIHLDSEDATVKEMGRNWNGRKTKLFGYSTEPPIPLPVAKSHWKFIGWVTASTVGAAGIAWLIINFEKVTPYLPFVTNSP